MGVKKLPKTIETLAGTAAVKSYKFSEFKNMPVSVDASLIIHQTVIAMRSSGHDMKNKNGGLTSHLYGLFYKILIFLQNGMKPIFVFDGKAPDIKNKTIEKRQAKKKLAEQKLKELDDSDDEEYIKNFRQTFKPTKEDMKEAQTLLDLMGIPYIVAPGEADVVCAWLAARHDSNGNRYVKGVCSDDSDMLALGAPYLFKDMLRFMNKNKPIKVISLNKALVKMNLSMDQFIDLCVLLGTDYCDNIKGMGPAKAFKLISKYGTLDKVLNSLAKTPTYDNSDPDTKLNEECMRDAQNYFKTALNEIDESDDFVLTDDQLELRKYQYEELMDFMCVKHDFDVSRIQTGIDRLKKSYKEMNVTRENTKVVHKIIHPRSENYVFRAMTEDLEFISSSTDSEEIMHTKKNSRNQSKTKQIGFKNNTTKIKFVPVKKSDNSSSESNSGSEEKRIQLSRKM